jgi:hypothetical protein
MFQKSKITFYGFILCLFGFTLITVSPVCAEESMAFKACKDIKGKEDMNAKKNCFRDGWKSMTDEVTQALKILTDAQKKSSVDHQEKPSQGVRGFMTQGIFIPADGMSAAEKECRDLFPEYSNIEPDFCLDDW